MSIELNEIRPEILKDHIGDYLYLAGGLVRRESLYKIISVSDSMIRIRGYRKRKNYIMYRRNFNTGCMIITSEERKQL
jgi:hypothetical protein